MKKKKKKGSAASKVKMTVSKAKKLGKILEQLLNDIADATESGEAIYSFHAKKKYFDSLHKEGLIKRGGTKKKGWVLSVKGKASLYEE